MDRNDSANGAGERCPGNLCAYISSPIFHYKRGKQSIDSLLHDFCSKCSSQAEVEPLCKFCKHLRLRHLIICLQDRLSNLWISLDLNRGTRGDGLSRIMSNKGCAVCSFLAHAIRSYFVMAKKHVKYEEVTEVQIVLSSSRYVVEGILELLITTLDKEYKVAIAYRRSYMNSISTIGGRISWPAVQQWIGCPSDSRDLARWTPSEIPQGFRLIDVDDRKVVSNFPPGSKLGSDIRFVALSYVWGTTVASKDDALLGSNEHQLTAPQGLGRINVPRAIEDAMTVCQQLGQRFLWVDRFCIQQDGPESEKREQINAMGDIYSSAEFTIIHASGTSMHDPIAGVSTTREVFQLKTAVCGLDFTIEYPDLEVALQVSRWAERGWTYQEAVLSQKRLFFTPFELWFECNDGNSPRKREGPHSTRTGHGSAYLIRRHGLDIDDFVRCLTEYTRKSLTHQSDTLDAFQGILSMLYQGGPVMYGLPEADLDRALLWHCKAQPISTVAAVGFPSWSWASAGQAVTASHSAYGEEFLGSLVEWSYKDGNGDLRPVRSENLCNFSSRYKPDASARALLLVAWWKGCIEPGMPEDVRQDLEKDVSSCCSLDEPPLPFIENVWAHIRYSSGSRCSECDCTITKRWPSPEALWKHIQRVRDSAGLETQSLESGTRKEVQSLIEKLRPGALFTHAQTAYFKAFITIRSQPYGLLRTNIYLRNSSSEMIGMIMPHNVDMTPKMALDNTMPELFQGDSLECMGISLANSGSVWWNSEDRASPESRFELKHRLRELAVAMSANSATTVAKLSIDDSSVSKCGAVNVLVIQRQEGSPLARRIGVGWVFLEDWLQADRTFRTIALG
ncbi:HET domain-containing protein [Trichoderma gracile]